MLALGKLHLALSKLAPYLHTQQDNYHIPAAWARMFMLYRS